MEKMIYAILSAKRDTEKLNALLVGMKGISGAGLYAVCFNKISTVVGDMERADLMADKSNTIVYAGVIETLAQQFALFAMRFGSVMESADVIIKMPERNAEITGRLARLNAVGRFKKMATASVMVDAVFLPGMERKEAMIQAVGDLQNQYHGLSFVMTGP